MHLSGRCHRGSPCHPTGRIFEHKQGRVKSTCKRLPIRLIHYEAYLLKDDAKRREKYLKSTEGKYFLKQQLKSLLNRVYFGK